MKIGEHIYRHLPLGLKALVFKRFRMDRPCGYGEIYRTTLNTALDTFLTLEEKASEQLVKKLTDDIILCWLKYKALPYEYFLYDLRNSDDRKRATFMTDTQKNVLCLKHTGLEAYQRELNDKYAFYQLMKPFFCRKVFLFNRVTDKEEFIRFALDAKTLFCKLSKGSRGKDALSVDVMDRKEAETLFDQLFASGDEWVVEERIKQTEEMARWNPSCVNTVRLPAFITKDGFKVLDPFFRTGRAGSVVDNAGQGGVFAAIDPETGVLISDGVDEYCHVFPAHPDSGLTFKGWQIPCWKELLSVAERAHRTISHHKYIGWDFALTDQGWVLIEGNWGQLVGQYATKVGVKDLFMSYISD